MTRLLLTAALAAWLLCATAAHAGTCAIDFSALAADAGQVVTRGFATPDGFVVQVDDMRVIGPGVAGYTGSIGVEAVSGDSMIVIQHGSGGQDGDYFGLHSVSAAFAPSADAVVRWAGRLNIDDTGPYWDWVATAPATLTFVSSPDPYSTNRIMLRRYGPEGSQMTGLSIVADLPGVVGPTAAVPEPSGLLLGGVAIAAVAMASRLMRTSGSCRARP